MNDPLLFPDEGAAPLGSNSRANDEHREFSDADDAATTPSHRNAPPGTSEVAANRMAKRAPALRERVFAYIESRGLHGATDDEGEAALCIKCQTYTPRRNELAKAVRVVDSGRRRPTSSGCPAAVWIAAQFAPKPAPTSTSGVTGEVGP